MINLVRGHYRFERKHSRLNIKMGRLIDEDFDFNLNRYMWVY